MDAIMCDYPGLDENEACPIEDFDLHNTTSFSGDEEAMDQQEIEAMLYAQIYFEQQPESKDTNVTVEETIKTSTPAANLTSMASMLNFSGRQFSNIQEASPQLKPKCDLFPREKDCLTDGSTSCDVITISSDSRGSPKKSSQSDSVIVLSDSDFEVEPKRHIKKLEKPDGKSKKRMMGSKSSESDEPKVKKIKKHKEKDMKQSKNRQKENVSQSHKKRKKRSDTLMHDSDSDDMLLDDDSGLAMEDSINIHAIGLRNVGFTPVSARVLAKVDLSKWEGDPPLTIEQVQSKLGDGDWSILDDDKYCLRAARQYGHKNVTCRNCREKGHLERECRKPRFKICALCSRRGHAHFRCPNKLCFVCNSPGHRADKCEKRHQLRFTCLRCGVKGHIKQDCPEIWRQYHSVTTEDKNVVIQFPKENCHHYCYNCGLSGHFGHECPKTQNYPLCPFVKEYKLPGSKTQINSRLQIKNQCNTSNQITNIQVKINNVAKNQGNKSQGSHSHDKKGKGNINQPGKSQVGYKGQAKKSQGHHSHDNKVHTSSYHGNRIENSKSQASSSQGYKNNQQTEETKTTKSKKNKKRQKKQKLANQRSAVNKKEPDCIVISSDNEGKRQQEVKQTKRKPAVWDIKLRSYNPDAPPRPRIERTKKKRQGKEEKWQPSGSMSAHHRNRSFGAFDSEVMDFPRNFNTNDRWLGDNRIKHHKKQKHHKESFNHYRQSKTNKRGFRISDIWT